MTREHPAGSRVMRQAGKPAATNAAPRPSPVASVSEFEFKALKLAAATVGDTARSIALGLGLKFYHFNACNRRATSSALARLLKALMRK